MPRTTILQPLPEDENTDKVKNYLKSINNLMEQFFKKKDAELQTFEDILGQLEIDEEEYII